MGEFDDTDELPSTTEVFEVPKDSPAAPDHEAGGGEEATTTRLPDTGDRRDGGNDLVERTERAQPEPAGPTVRSARFRGSRRRALLWDAGWCLVAGVALLALASAGRPVDYGPAWASAVAGGVGIGWGVVLVAIAAGGVSRGATALVGTMNLAAGAGAFLFGWTRPVVPTLVLVLAAQVVGFGLVQVVTSVRR